jgi:cyclopropane fatty-acyl-phospholipid synthase-like methyltransferase
MSLFLSFKNMEEQNNNTNTTHTDISTQPTNIEMLNTFIDPNLMQNQQNAWNNVYKNYGSLPWTTKMWQEKSLAPIYSFINNHNLKINSLLDYGGGSGHIAVAMKENFDIPKVVVADISENAFNKEDLEKNNIKCQIASFPENVDGKFDSIVCWGVFHHINPTLYEPILQQFRKKLNDNGVLFLGAWSSKDKYLAGKDKAPSLYS